jgi:hypothetical protein
MSRLLVHSYYVSKELVASSSESEKSKKRNTDAWKSLVYCFKKITQNSFCESHTVCLLVKAKNSIREECQFMDLLYKELTYVPHEPANNQ